MPIIRYKTYDKVMGESVMESKSGSYILSRIASRSRDKKNQEALLQVYFFLSRVYNRCLPRFLEQATLRSVLSCALIRLYLMLRKIDAPSCILFAIFPRHLPYLHLHSQPYH